MMAGARSYRFATDAQWRICLTTGLVAAEGGGLTAPPVIGETAVGVGSAETVSAVAVDRVDRPLWRIDGALRRFADFGAATAAKPVDGVLARSPRLLLSRHWVWAFAQDRVVRFDLPTLQRDWQLAVADLTPDLPDPSEPWHVLDIADDGRDGVWLLLGSSRMRHLLHIDCHDCRTGPIALTEDCREATQIATTGRGTAIVLLVGDCLAFLDPVDGSLIRRSYPSDVVPGFQPTRLAGDGRERLALGGFAGIALRAWSLILLDGDGETTQDPLQNLVAAQVNDIAASGGSVWLATDAGLFCSDAGAASGGASLAAVLQTPVLHAPASESGRGWSRAELDVEAPDGVTIVATVASTNDPRFAHAAAAVAADPTLSAAARRERIWSLLDPAGSAVPLRLKLSGPDEGKLAIPLFDHHGAWLVLRLDIVAPPLSARVVVQELTVLYPERSLMEQLPAIFSDPANDPQGLLRKIVGALETTTQQIDRDIVSIGSRLEARTAPTKWLDYLGSWLDLPWHSGLAEGSKRRIISAAGRLLDWRGTRRGLLLLAECLAGEGGSAAVVDVTAEHGPLLLGGGGRPGSPLRGLVAGYRATRPQLGVRTVLGRTQLVCETGAESPLDILSPTAIVKLYATAAIITANAHYAEDVIAQYAPAGVAIRIAWTRILPHAKMDSDDGGITLEAIGEATVGTDAVIGASTLGGLPGRKFGDGFGQGMRLR